jgi:hypothetical protein
MKRFAPVLLLSVALIAQAQKPRRVVYENVITSDQKPNIRIELPKEARYLGVDKWILYGVADCELHVWIEAGSDNVVNRLYWVQFEAYLPDKAGLHYNYPFKRTTNIGGLDFDVRARFGANDAQPKPESDGGHVWALLQASGYKWSRDAMNVRLVYLPDEQKRTELMIIYAEDLKPTGLTAADLLPGGKASDRWPMLEQGLIERAANKLKLSLPTR